jgi:hypothetical protein
LKGVRDFVSATERDGTPNGRVEPNEEVPPNGSPAATRAVESGTSIFGAVNRAGNEVGSVGATVARRFAPSHGCRNNVPLRWSAALAFLGRARYAA